ncbi:MAG: carboxypeptidase M32 [Gemmatimonadota bacterium]
MPSQLDALKAHMSDVLNLGSVSSILHWDQNTYMPPNGSKARAAQQATIGKLRHDLFISDRTAKLIEAAAGEVDLGEAESDDAILIRNVRRDFEYESKLPSDFVAEFANAQAAGFDVWRKAREADDWAAFVPALQRLLDLKLREAELRGYDEHVYDVFLGSFERGMKTSEVQALFEAEKPALIELIAEVDRHQDRVDDSVLHQSFDPEAQRALSRFAAEAFGVDFGVWANLGEVTHPFCSRIANGDVRITTRYSPGFFNAGFYATLHETGHGLHGHGFAPEIDGTYLADLEGSSPSVAESQSRTWENLVGRSREYWEWMLPHARKFFPEQLAHVDAEGMYRAVNKVRPQFIRVEADELTYNLHIMLRMEIEMDMVTGALALKDVPEAWNEKFESYFGITPPNDAEGCLQDVHWSFGGIGLFIGYALGNMLAVQYYNRALEDHPGIPAQIARGDFETLHGWLREKIYKHGRKFTADEITRRATGEGIRVEPHVEYLKNKFADVYQLG